MEEALIKRVMPHSVEAEQSVVGAMLMDKDAILAASEIICDYHCIRDHQWSGFLSDILRSGI